MDACCTLLKLNELGNSQDLNGQEAVYSELPWGRVMSNLGSDSTHTHAKPQTAPTAGPGTTMNHPP